MKERQQHENKMKKKTRNITLDGELFYRSAAVLSLPPDIVLNRYQGAPRMGVAYRSVAHCLSELVRNEGGLALFRGLGPQYAKLAPIFLFTLPLYEQLRRLAGLGYLK